MDQMSGYLKAAEQSKAALSWLETRQSDWVAESDKNHLKVNHQEWGTGVDGFTDANRVLTVIMEQYEKRIVADAIQLCRNRLKEAEHQIKYWAERL